MANADTCHKPSGNNFSHYLYHNMLYYSNKNEWILMKIQNLYTGKQTKLNCTNLNYHSHGGENNEELQCLATEYCLHVDIYWVQHHGRSTGILIFLEL